MLIAELNTKGGQGKGPVVVLKTSVFMNRVSLSGIAIPPASIQAEGGEAR